MEYVEILGLKTQMQQNIMGLSSKGSVWSVTW